MPQPRSATDRPGIGFLIAVLAAGFFLLIAADVSSVNRLTQLDAAVAEWLHRHATAGTTAVLLAVTNLHSTVAISIYAVAASVFFYWRRQWRRLLAVFVCIAGGLTLNVLLKLIFHRARPVFDDPLLTLPTYSFPSGHVVASTLFYGLVVAAVWAHTRRPLPRLLTLVAALAAVSLVALTRMYLGVHYLSDVAAAFAEAVAWLALCLSGMALWRAAPGALRTSAPGAVGDSAQASLDRGGRSSAATSPGRRT